MSQPRPTQLTALYPGSFDPLHNGHVDIINKTCKIFDQVVVAAMRNPAKSNQMFSETDRSAMINESLSHLPQVKVVESTDLVIQVAAQVGASVIVKGLRSAVDFDLEMQMSHMNESVSGVQTIFVPCSLSEGFIASNFIREIVSRGGDCSHLVPPPVAVHLKRVAASADPPTIHNQAS